MREDPADAAGGPRSGSQERGAGRRGPGDAREVPFSALLGAARRGPSLHTGAQRLAARTVGEDAPALSVTAAHSVGYSRPPTGQPSWPA